MQSSAPVQTEVVLGTTTRRGIEVRRWRAVGGVGRTGRAGRAGQAGFGTGATGLDPATSGVTGHFEDHDG